MANGECEICEMHKANSHDGQTAPSAADGARCGPFVSNICPRQMSR